MFDDMLEEVLALGGDAPMDEGEADSADTTADVHCPYCGEPSEVILDPGGGADQSYIEDCEVCCRPWNVRVRWAGGAAQVDVQTEDDSAW